LLEEMDFLGPMRASEVEAIQTEIVDVVRKLEDAGAITVSANGGDERFIQ